MRSHKSVYAAVFQNHQHRLFSSWPECENAVKGKSGARHKGFNSKEDAQDWVAECLGLPSRERQTNHIAVQTTKINNIGDLDPTQVIDLYVDGSYREGISRRAGWGWVAIQGGLIIAEEFGVTQGDALSRNIDGELESAIKAMEWAFQRGLQARIFHDYVGIAAWVEGKWNANKPISKSYLQRTRHISGNISFVKVRGHSDDTWNDYADNLATNAITEFIKGSKNR